MIIIIAVMSSDPALITRREADENDTEELAGQPSKKLRGKEEGGEGGELTEHTDLPGKSEVPKDGSC